jgi:hypothetical protein
MGKAVTEPQPGGGFFFCNALNLGAVCAELFLLGILRAQR